MQVPKFPVQVAKMKDIRIVNGMQRILNFFHAEARDGYCKGDLFGGWDWPTMNVLWPELCAKYRELKAEAIRRLDTKGGKLAGQQYEKTEKGWKAVQPAQ